MSSLGRITRSADFARVLRTAPRTRSAHFALHHLDVPAAPARPRLSTSEAQTPESPVDDRPRCAHLGSVVPKRHARRAVTRNAVRRAIREAASRRVPPLAAGLWIVRLREPFDRALFRSAASEPLVAALRAELAGLFGAAAGPRR